MMKNCFYFAACALLALAITGCRERPSLKVGYKYCKFCEGYGGTGLFKDKICQKCSGKGQVLIIDVEKLLPSSRQESKTSSTQESKPKYLFRGRYEIPIGDTGEYYPGTLEVYDTYITINDARYNFRNPMGTESIYGSASPVIMPNGMSIVLYYKLDCLNYELQFWVGSLENGYWIDCPRID